LSLLHPRTATAWFWLFPALPALFVLVVLLNARAITYSRLEDEGVVTRGVFEQSACDEGRFTYRFEAGGRTYTGRARAWRYGVNCIEVIAGQPVMVAYLPEDPTRNAATRDPRRLYMQELTIVGGLTVVCYLACLGIVWYDAKKRGATR
jgi:hypothetical protein